jgi:bleomycin hydrolase
MSLSIAAAAQNLGEKDLQDIRASFKLDKPTAAIQNALTNDASIKTQALNRELQGKIDHYFKYRVKVKGITDQKSSGRCWMFSSLNALRPLVIKKYRVEEFDFSHNYLYFWDIFEKSNLFLENIIGTAKRPFDDRDVEFLFKAPIADGGHWSFFYNVAEKYGVVPQEVMPETAHSNSTSEMRSLLNERLRGGGYKLRQMAVAGKKTPELQAEKKAILADAYRILALCLGEPPVNFTWRYKTKGDTIKELSSYTPKQFYKEIVPSDYSASSYVMVVNDPTREYYKMFEVESCRNSHEGINWCYLNLPIDELKKAALASIKANESLYAACDVNKQHNRETGILDPSMYNYQALLGTTFDMDKKARILTYQSSSSHAMLLMACDTDNDDVPTKWEFENSWGDKAGNKGYLTFTDSWFNEYLFCIVAHRRFLSDKAVAALGQKPTILPMWDYMN